MRNLMLTVASLALAACATNRPPAPAAASHPPAPDLTCPAEPPALTDQQAAGANGDALEQAFNDAVLIAGRDCRDALGRVCRWHVERGMTGVVCPPAIRARTSWRTPARPTITRA
jgi:hypothetical protein